MFPTDSLATFTIILYIIYTKKIIKQNNNYCRYKYDYCLYIIQNFFNFCLKNHNGLFYPTESSGGY